MIAIDLQDAYIDLQIDGLLKAQISPEVTLWDSSWQGTKYISQQWCFEMDHEVELTKDLTSAQTTIFQIGQEAKLTFKISL